MVNFSSQLKRIICAACFLLSIFSYSQVTRAIAASSDDAEERISSGNMDLTSSDLELCTESGDQYVGLRFQNIIIPNGANITNAYIQFMVDETNSTSVNLNITGIDVDDASTFTSADYNISQRIDGTISSNTTANIVWTPANWPTVGAQGVDQQTPDISTIVKEIVDRGGWSSGNAMSFVFSKISGSGKRVAESYNGSNNPTLYVTYNTTPEITFFDSDGDGVLDNIDIDDDNDGIVDSEEQNNCTSSSFSTVTNYKFLNETFGTGNRTTINTTYDATTSYCYEDAAGSGCSGGIDLNDGEYVVYYKAGDGDGTNDTPVEEVASWADAYWYTGEDHTSGDTNGRMAMFNASYDPGTFYTANITGALPNVAITYSFWVLNLDTTDAPGIGTRLRPNILVEFRDTSNNLLASITTGDIPPSINGDPANSWHQFTANLTFTVDEFNVYFINNETGGSGNDLAIDDIIISQTLCDTDNDTIADVFDLDADNDGIPDVVEAGLGIYSDGNATLTGSGSWLDTNANGMHDLAEGNVTLDSDSDGTPNYLDLDSDNDTIFDVDESGAGNLSDTSYQNGDGDINGDGVGDGTDSDQVRETDVDSDGTLEYYADGILDLYDFFNGGALNTAYGNVTQGTGYTQYVKDTDTDGIPDYIDIMSDGTTYDISHTLYADLDADLDGLIDDTNDNEGDGIVDLFDTDDATFGSPRDINKKLHLFFDGRNDYAEDVAVISGWGEATIMSWIKIDPSASGVQTIVGQDEFYLQLNADKSITAYADGNTLTNGSALTTNQWIHIGATYSDSNSIFKLYVNGLEIASIAISGALNTDTSNFTLGRLPNTDSNYFHGYLDEVRVFNKALSDNELQKTVYQEIEDNSGTTRGSYLPKDITDFDTTTETSTPLNWSMLERYFRMDTYKDDIIDDLTTAAIDVGTGAKIYNTKVIDWQSAPLPFITQQSGSLPTAVNIAANGVNGNDAVTYDWSIIKVKHNNVTYNSNQKHLGLIIDELDAGSNPITYTVNNDSELNVSWYLELDGKIDLEGESQLIQGPESFLDPTSSGTLEKDQQGTADTYTYNFWGMPVGLPNITTNNNSYAVEDLFDVNFLTSGYNGTASPVAVADYWIWKFSNEESGNYSKWQQIRSTGTLAVGEGFTMKGPGTGTITTPQNYVLEGKPNNGDINLSINSGNDYLLGNPYPCAIDAHEFITDNGPYIDGPDSGPTINGTLYFWEHWGGGTHNLGEYQGGYATYTLAGGVPAAALGTNHPDVGTGGTPTKTPGRYIPVAQGFFVTAENTGTIQFNNSQRVFQVEDGTNSVFTKTGNTKKEKTSKHIAASTDTRLKLRIGFNSVNTLRRQLLVTVDSLATVNYDWGFEAPYFENQMDDLYWMINNDKYVIQGIDCIDEFTILPLGIHTKNEGLNSIVLDKIENSIDGLNVYLHDKALEIYHDLKVNNYDVYLSAGQYLDRFEITFSDPSKTEDEVFEHQSLLVYFSNEKESIVIHNPVLLHIESIEMYNILSQLIFETKTSTNENYMEYYTNKIKPGTYIIKMRTQNGTLSKKVLIE